MFPTPGVYAGLTTPVEAINVLHCTTPPNDAIGAFTATLGAVMDTDAALSTTTVVAVSCTLPTGADTLTPPASDAVSETPVAVCVQ